ncbi:hypothetical protein L227DRAFT_118404 [Lentinus tigrinus ALCF2SS1-6]|uniref:Uncharacterized protein n=1 Tax=Lentinus tigrinus ALCF2SS1-6 TaxID=1328759 RepID=A0A5C2S7T4_9APHY|nr:hypothetical protein L227DRAFT_118404 [Lentinus tigrinus ALCF2SS1-6]
MGVRARARPGLHGFPVLSGGRSPGARPGPVRQKSRGFPEWYAVAVLLPSFGCTLQCDRYRRVMQKKPRITLCETYVLSRNAHGLEHGFEFCGL